MPPRAPSIKAKKAAAAPPKAKSSLSKSKAESASLKSKSGGSKSSAASQKTSGSKPKRSVKAAKPKVTGLELASKQFRLVNPVSAPDGAWEEYVKCRLGETKRGRAYSAAEAPEYEDEEDRCNDDEERIIYEGVHETVKRLEKECELEAGVLAESVWVESCSVDGLEQSTTCAPRNCETYSRVYSLATPAHVDVHFQYHERARMESVEWNYCLGYKIHNLPEGHVTFRITSNNNKSHRGRAGMQSICWACYDDEEGFRHGEWRRVEVSGFDLDEGDVLDIHRALFGPLEPLAADADDDVVEERRRTLVRTVRILLASVGINYIAGCKDGEQDERRPRRSVALNWTLESSSIDKWIARGIRKACGFQLASDPEMEKEAIQARRDEELELAYHESDDSDTSYVTIYR